MDIVNKTDTSVELVQQIAKFAEISERHLLLYLDDQINRTDREAARCRIEENTRKGWKPLPWDLEKIRTDKDVHAFFCAGNVVDSQAVPQYLKDSARGYDSMIYVDQTFLCGHAILTASTMAHECRHAWQYYERPLTYFGNLVLNWVIEPHTTPAEQDAEGFAKRASIDLFGEATVNNFAQDRINKGSSEEIWMWQRFAKSALAENYDLETQTRNLLFQYATQMRRAQESLKIDIPMLETTASHLSSADAISFLRQAKR
jgi:hypothetical protein